VLLQIGGDLVVVEQGVVNVKQKNYLPPRGLFFTHGRSLSNG
jgi:hypothetical protein